MIPALIFCNLKLATLLVQIFFGRLGTPALTTRGFGEAEMDQVADLLVSAITNPEESNLARCRAAVRGLCERFPAPVEGLV